MKPRESQSHPGPEGQNDLTQPQFSENCSNDTAEDPRLLEAVKGYLAALESGGRPSRREWLERFPDIAAELSVYLDGLAFVHSAAGRLAQDAGKKASASRSGNPSRHRGGAAPGRLPAYP